MPRAKRVCRRDKCPKIAHRDGLCPGHLAEEDARRGSRQERGYGPAYDRERRRWEPKVEAGQVTCWRCPRLIQPGTDWHLGHDDETGAALLRPEHASCNTRAAGLKAHGLPWTPAP